MAVLALLKCVYLTQRGIPGFQLWAAGSQVLPRAPQQCSTLELKDSGSAPIPLHVATIQSHTFSMTFRSISSSYASGPQCELLPLHGSDVASSVSDIHVSA